MAQAGAARRHPRHLAAGVTGPGVATLGNLYGTLAPLSRVGVEGAVLAALAVRGVIAVGVAAAATQLSAR